MTDYPVPEQLTRDDLKSMTGAEVMAARREGKLATLLGLEPQPVFPTDGQLGEYEWGLMSRTDRHAAIRRGQFANYIRNYRKESK